MSNLRNSENPFIQRLTEQSQARRSKRLQQTKTKRIANQHREYVGENHQISIDEVKIDNPYKSKNPKFSKDPNPYKQQEKFQRHTFAKFVNTYELDLMFFTYNPDLQQAIYLVLINVNTRFAHVVLIPDKTKDSIKRAISKLIYYGLKITNIRYDGELALSSDEMKEFWNSMNVNFYQSKSKFTNKNRIVDRFIRTLRDLYFNSVGTKKLSYEKQHNMIQQLVTVYNNTEHSTLGKKPAEMTYEDEYQYIEQMEQLNRIQKQKQSKEGLLEFVTGEKIKIYLNTAKTDESFTKKRGNFIHDATFLGYDHGNVICKLNGKVIEIPIFWVKPKEK